MAKDRTGPCKVFKFSGSPNSRNHPRLVFSDELSRVDGIGRDVLRIFTEGVGPLQKERTEVKLLLAVGLDAVDGVPAIVAPAIHSAKEHNETPPSENQILFATLTVRTHVWIKLDFATKCDQKYGASSTANCVPKQTLSFTQV